MTAQDGFTRGGVSPSGGRHFGYRPDHPRVRSARVSVVALLPHFGAVKVAPSSSLARFRAPIYDQGPFGSCGGHGSAQLTATAMGAAGMPLPFIPSPGHIYANTRLEELQSPTDPLTDSGILPSDLLSALSAYGVRDMLSTPGLVDGKAPDGRQSDVWGANINEKPSFVSEEQGVDNLIVGEYAIPVGTPHDTDDLMAATIDIVKRPVGVGLFVDSAFMSWQGGAPIDSMNVQDPQGGGHWVSVDGYTTETINGLSQRVYDICNSWGAAAGVNGIYRITARALAQAMSDAIAWTVSPG